MTLLRQHRSVVIAVSGALITASLLTTAAFAREEHLGGRPPELDSGGHVCYFLWRNGDELHLRDTASETSDRYTVKLHTPGQLVDVDRVGPRHEEHFSLSDDGHTLRFRSRPGSDVNGLDLRVEGSNPIKVNLKINGAPAPTDEIYLGEDGNHPKHSHFGARV